MGIYEDLMGELTSPEETNFDEPYQNYSSGKYQLLCANCHKKETAKRAGFNRNLLKEFGRFPKGT